MTHSSYRKPPWKSSSLILIRFNLFWLSWCALEFMTHGRVLDLTFTLIIGWPRILREQCLLGFVVQSGVKPLWFYLFMEHKSRYHEKYWIWFCQYNESQWGSRQHWTLCWQIIKKNSIQSLPNEINCKPGSYLIFPSRMTNSDTTVPYGLFRDILFKDVRL